MLQLKIQKYKRQLTIGCIPYRRIRIGSLPPLRAQRPPRNFVGSNLIKRVEIASSVRTESQRKANRHYELHP
jgi:hypothetical protein